MLCVCVWGGGGTVHSRLSFDFSWRSSCEQEPRPAMRGG